MSTPKTNIFTDHFRKTVAAYCDLKIGRRKELAERCEVQQTEVWRWLSGEGHPGHSYTLTILKWLPKGWQQKALNPS